MQPDKRQIHQYSSRHRLNDSDHRSLLTGGFKLRQPKFVSDGKCNKAEGGIAEYTKAVYCLHAGKTKPRYSQSSKAVRPHQKPCQKKCRHIREMQMDQFEYTGHKKPCQERS